MTHILWLGDSPELPTGFGNELESLIKGLDCEHSVAAIRHQGFKIELPNYTLYSYKGLQSYLQELKDIDYVISVGGSWMFMNAAKIAEILDAEWLQLYRIDGRPMPKNHSKFLIGQNAKAIVCSDWLAEECDKRFVDYEKIHQGFDFDVWKPQGIEKDRLTFGCMMRNMAPRKNYDILLKAWKEFSEGKKDVELLLRCDPEDDQGWPLATLVQEMNLSKVRFAQLNQFQGIEYSEIPKIYSQMDVFVSATGGEAFGRPFVEAQAMQIPTIAPDYTSSKELIPEELRVEIENKYVPKGHAYWLARPKVSDLVDKMEMLYQDKDLIDEFGEKGFEMIREYDENSMIEEWERLLDL